VVAQKVETVIECVGEDLNKRNAADICQCLASCHSAPSGALQFTPGNQHGNKLTVTREFTSNSLTGLSFIETTQFLKDQHIPTTMENPGGQSSELRQVMRCAHNIGGRCCLKPQFLAMIAASPTVPLSRRPLVQGMPKGGTPQLAWLGYQLVHYALQRTPHQEAFLHFFLLFQKEKK